MLALAVAYAALCRITLSTKVLDGGMVAVWPPAGLALAALLRFGVGLWPGLLAGAWAGNLLGIAGPVDALGEAIGATAGVVITAVLVGRMAPGVRFDRLREVLALLLAASLGATVSAVIGVSSLWLADHMVWDSWSHGVLVWALGDVEGMLLLAPVLLALAQRPRIERPSRAIEAAVAIVALLAGAHLLFHTAEAQLWLLMPLCVWIALRYGFTGAVVAALGLAIISVTETNVGHGPFEQGTDFDLVRAQAFAIVSAGMLFIVAAVTEERRSALRQYRSIAAEDAALRRVATAVAASACVDDVCQMAGEELADLFDVEVGLVFRFEEGDRGRAYGRWIHQGPFVPDADGLLPIVPGSAIDAVRRAGAPADFGQRTDVPALAPFTKRVAAPIHAEGRLWGALLASTGRDAGLPRDLVPRLERFADLVGLAVSGAAAHERLIAEATTDSLTDLVNHRGLHERLAEQVALASRTGQPLSVVVLDIDRFKPLNDALGHEAGDDVLREIARRIRAVAREGELLARVQGDEFAAVLPGTGAAEAQQAADRLRRSITAEPFDGGVELTVSAGVADLTHANDAADLLAFADGALYWAKSNGRDATCVYDPVVVEELSADDRAERLERTKALGAVRALAQAIDAKDAATIEHSERVARLAARLAEVSGWAPSDVARIHDAGLVHDVGKIGIPDAILSKPGRLTDEEYDAIKRHSALGARIVSEVLDEEQVAWVRGHHERHDGRGYPDGLAGEAITEGARLMALADAWDAMTGARVYSDPMPVDEALCEVTRCEGTQFHPDAVAALKQLDEQGRLTEPPALVHSR